MTGQNMGRPPAPPLSDHEKELIRKEKQSRDTNTSFFLTLKLESFR